jgi:NDP-sugar pyrophosphorylase family protein
MPKDAPSNLANTGLYLISPEARKIFKEKVLKQIMEEKHRLDFGYDFIPYVIKAGYPVYGYTLKGNWFDVGTPKNYLEAMKKMLYGCFSKITDFGGRLNDETPIWVQGESNESETRRDEIIQKIKKRRIRIEGAVLIGRHCQIDDGARIVDSCIDNYTKIGKNAVIQNSSIMDRTIIGEEAEVLDSIIGRHTTIHSSQAKPTRISSVSVIADDVSIDEGSVLAATKIYPHQSLRGEFQHQTVMPS